MRLLKHSGRNQVTIENHYVAWNKGVSPLAVSPSAKCDCFPLSEVSPGSLLKTLGCYYSHVLCVLFFSIKEWFGHKSLAVILFGGGE